MPNLTITVKWGNQETVLDPPAVLTIYDARDMQILYQDTINFVPFTKTFPLTEDTYIVAVRHTQFKPYSKKIKLTRNTTLTIELKPAIFFGEVKPFVVAPNIDIASSISGAVAENLTKWMREHKIAYESLFGFGANKLYTTLYLLAQREGLVFYYGHGLKDRWFGVTGFLLTTSDAHLLANKVTYSLACYTASKLGPTAVKEGAIAYIGFTETVYVAFKEGEHDYFKDFVEFANTVPKALLTGHTVREAVNQAKQLGHQLAQFYKEKHASGEFLNGDWYAYAISWNTQHLTSLGDNNYHIEVSQLDKEDVEKIKNRALSMVFGLFVPLAVVPLLVKGGEIAYKEYKKLKSQQRK